VNADPADSSASGITAREGAARTGLTEPIKLVINAKMKAIWTKILLADMYPSPKKGFELIDNKPKFSRRASLFSVLFIKLIELLVRAPPFRQHESFSESGFIYFFKAIMAGDHGGESSYPAMIACFLYLYTDYGPIGFTRRLSKLSR
jgi:hypothetical protein